MKISTDGTNSILNNIAKAKLDYVDLAQKKEANPRFEKLKKAAQNFEAIFITQILSNMRRSINSGLFGQGMSSDMYHRMFDENIAQAIASKGGFGLSDIIIKSLHKDNGQEESAPGATLADYWLRPIRRISTKKMDRNWDRSIINKAADKFGVDAKLVEAIIKVESNYNAKAISKKGAVGLMQLMKSTAEQMGVKNRYNPEQNIFGGVNYLKTQLDHFGGNLELALSAYNAGTAAVEKFNGIPPYEETQGYVKKVLKAYREM